MAGLAFAFRAQGRTPLVFRWPLEIGLSGRLRNPRYRWVPPPTPPTPPTGVGCNPRYRSLPVPFPGELPPQNVRAGSCGSAYRPASAGAATLRLGWRTSPAAATTANAAWRAAAGLAQGSAWPWHPLPPTAAATPGTVVWRDSHPASNSVTLPYTVSPLVAGVWGSVWRQASPLANPVTGVWRGLPVLGALARLGWRESQPGGRALYSAESSATPVQADWMLPWGAARPLGALSWPWPTLPALPPTLPRPGLRFHFHAPVFAPLVFHFGRAPAWVIPILRSYRMRHTLSVVRLPDRTPLPVTALTVNSAWDEWSWSLSATLSAAALELLRPIVAAPVEIEVTVDGNTWQFRLDQVSGSTAFARVGGQTQGRGRAALLGPGVALPANGYETEAKTAQQLAAQELTGTSWQLDWDAAVPDWLVPARTFSYTQKTPIEVIVQIAETAGARVCADPALAWLRVTPRYPAAPWAWSGMQPDILLPRSIMTTLGWKPRLGQPWDAVFLGDGADVLAKVKRAGLPGASIPDSPTIEPLLCHLDACRARGLAILSDAVAGVDFTLALPVSSAGGPSPLRAVGELARFEDGDKTWVGLITGVTVQVGFGTVVQTLEVRAVEVEA